MLRGEQLFYYKKTSSQDIYYNLISLQNAKIRLLPPTPEKLKLSKYYQHCFEFQNDTRKWVIACLSDEDLKQWANTIYEQIDQVQKRIAIQKMNSQIINLEREKSQIDMEIVKSLIKPSAVMFDHIQKSNLIGFFTNLDTFLNKLIPMLCVYFDQTLQCSQK